MIYIPTKGRAEKLKTLEHFSITPIILVIEPQESEAYLKAIEDKTNVQILTLGDNDQGIVYARNTILTHARDTKQKWIWMIDDDVQNFYERNNKGKSVKIGGDKLFERLNEILQTCANNIGQVGLEYQQFAWNSYSDYVTDSYCDVCVAINIPATRNITYRGDNDTSVLLKEDRDFTLQILASGLNSVRLQRYSFRCPKVGTNKGGLKPIYDVEDSQLKGSTKLLELWGEDIIKVVKKKSGRIDAKINWNYFSQIN